MNIVTGDVLLFRPTGFDPLGWLIQLFSKKHRYCHVGIALDGLNMIDMNIDGPKRSVIPKDKNIDVYRLNIDESPYLMRDDYLRYLFVKNAIDIAKKDPRYNLIGCIGQGINELIDDVIPEVASLPPIINDESQMNCSQFVAMAFREAFGYGIVDGVSSYNLKPDDLQNSSYLRFIFSMKSGIIVM